MEESKRYRILVAPPMYGGSLPVSQYCVSALRDLGHVVEVFDAPTFYGAFTGLKGLKVTSDRLEYLENSFLHVVSQALLAKVETFEPDMVLALSQAPLSRQALKRLRRDKVPTVMWFVEDFNVFTYWRGFAPFYDFFAVIQKEPFFEKLHEIEVENILYLPLAGLPEFHRPMNLRSVDKHKFGSEISFLGAGYPNRRVAFRRLAQRDFKIWGTEWEGEPSLEKIMPMKGARISSEDMVKIFNASAINLNLHSSVRTDRLVSGGDFVNPRTFELACCGAFQLVDNRELLAELFEDDELARFDSVDEMLDGIDYYLANPDKRHETAQKGRERVLRDHTYQRRMRTLQEFIDNALPGWPSRQAQTAFMPDMPLDLADDIAALLRELNLPRDASFTDVVSAIRQREGVLSELETAALFLDEWEKQYKTS